MSSSSCTFPPRPLYLPAGRRRVWWWTVARARPGDRRSRGWRAGCIAFISAEATQYLLPLLRGSCVNSFHFIERRILHRAIRGKLSELTLRVTDVVFARTVTSAWNTAGAGASLMLWSYRWMAQLRRRRTTNLRRMMKTAFNLGITISASRTVRPAEGTARSASERFARRFKDHRDELIVSSKVSRMWDNPYKEWGAKVSGVESRPIVEAARPGLCRRCTITARPDTPIEETLGA